MKKMLFAVAFASASFLGAVTLEEVSRDVLVADLKGGVAVEELKTRVMSALEEGVLEEAAAKTLCQELDEVAAI